MTRAFRRDPRWSAVALVAALVAPGIALSAVPQEGTPAPSPIVVFFYQEGCPDCDRVSEVLDALGGDLPAGSVARHEIGDPKSRRLFQRLQRAYGIDGSAVPLVFIGDRAIAGASRIQELALTDALGDCMTSSCPSPLDRLPPDVFPWIDLLEVGLLASLVLLLTLLQRP